jgi:Flp pilus assembly protein protease CpaA
MTYFIVQAILWGAVLTALLICAGVDLRERIIPDEAVAAIAVCGLLLGVMNRPGQLWLSVAAAFAALYALGLLCRMDLLGGGDAKLISALTLTAPPGRIGALLLCIVFAGGALGCVYLTARLVLRGRWFPQNEVRAVSHPAAVGPGNSLIKDECARIAEGGPMPYALAIVGGFAVYLAREFS